MFKVELVSEYIVAWMKDYINKAHQKGFVIGISGGLDSAVVSTLCANTDYPVLCIEMPIHQSEAEVNRAAHHIQWLQNNFKNVNGLKVDLTSVFDQFQSSVDVKGPKDLVDLSLANSRARLRMTTLYYYAAINHFVVVGTGNKVEDFGLGFFTKYGDGGVDISPIGDLMKSEVRDLGRHLGVSEEILKAQPTDGLFGDTRSDEDQIGATYPELEWAMLKAEEGKTEKDFVGKERGIMAIYLQRHRANLHKMVPVPLCKIPSEIK